MWQKFHVLLLFARIDCSRRNGDLRQHFARNRLARFQLVPPSPLLDPTPDDSLAIDSLQAQGGSIAAPGAF